MLTGNCSEENYRKTIGSDNLDKEDKIKDFYGYFRQQTYDGSINDSNEKSLNPHKTFKAE